MIVRILLIGLILGHAGCRERSESEADTFETLETYASLSAVSSSRHPAIREELARLEAEHATPLLLTERLRPSSPERDLQRRLDEVFAHTADLELLKQRLEPYRFRDEELLDAIELREVQAIVANHDSLRRRVRELMDVPGWQLSVDYRHGMAADLGFVDQLSVAAHLEHVEAARQLAADRIPEAMESVGYSFRLASTLDGVWHLVPRLEAAELRRQTLMIVAAIAVHRDVDRETITRLRDWLIAELSQWPDEAEAWIGDRAVGLHVFEMVRDGQILSLLTEDEFQTLKAAGERYATARDAMEHADRDQWFYLRIMRQLIEACDQPYYQRAEVLAAVQGEISERQNRNEFPLISGQILLPEISQAQRRLAMDRARMECWAIALSAGSGTRPPSSTVNPQSGEPYAVERRDGLVNVIGLDRSRGEIQPVTLDWAGPATGPDAQPQ